MGVRVKIMWNVIKSFILGKLFGFDGSVDRDYTGVFKLKDTKPKKTAQKVKIAADKDNKVKNGLKGGFKLEKDKLTINVPYQSQLTLKPSEVRDVACLFACITMITNYYGRKKYSVQEFQDFLNKCKEKKYQYVTGNAFVKNPGKIPSLEPSLKKVSLTYHSLSINDNMKASQGIIELLEKDIPVIIKLQHPSAKNKDGSTKTHYEVIFGYYWNKEYDEVVLLVHDPGWQQDKFLNPYVLKTFADGKQEYSKNKNSEAGDLYGKEFRRYGTGLNYYQKK
jgi:hypothetical protein